MERRKRYFFISMMLLGVMVLGWGGQVQSQEKYPARAIEIIVPYSAGGSTDLDARLAATYLSKKWGVPVNVVNQPGGNAIPGVLEVYKAPPDGYTMLFDGSATNSVMWASVSNLPFKVMDRTYVNRVIYNPNVMFVPYASSMKTLADFVALAKKNPENATWCLMGGTSTTDFSFRQLFKDIGVDISKTKPITVKGGADAATMVSGGHVMIGASTPTTILPAVQGKLLRGVLMASEHRFPLLPDVPTSVELGYPKNIYGNWVGISGPPNLPSYIIEKWDKDMQEMVKDPEIIAKVKELGGIPFYHNARSTKEMILKETEAIKEVMK